MAQESKPVLYINIVVIDVSEVIKAKVQEKVEASNIPKHMKGMVTKSATSVATSRINRSVVAAKVSEQLCSTMPPMMKEKGITVTMEEVFREEHYFVLELQVQHVDAIILEQEKAPKTIASGESGNDNSPTMTATLLDWTLKLIGHNNQHLLEGEFLPAKVQEKLETKMMKAMEEKFENMRLKAQVEILKETKQARYFYPKLKSIREETNKGASLARDFRKKLSLERGDEDGTQESKDTASID